MYNNQIIIVINQSKKGTRTTTSTIYKGKKLKDIQNQNINIQDFISIEDNNFTQCFQSYVKRFGKPTSIKVSEKLILIGTQSSCVLVFSDKFDFDGPSILGYDWTQNKENKLRGYVQQIDVSPDKNYVIILYSCKTLCLFDMKKPQELLTFEGQKNIVQAMFAPINSSSQQTTEKESYYELLVLDQLENITKFSLELNYTASTIKRSQSFLYKFGEACSQIKMKSDFSTKVYDSEYIQPHSTRILEFKIMPESYSNDIQVSKDGEFVKSESVQLTPEKQKTSEPDEQKGLNFLQRLFSKKDNNSPKEKKYIESNQFILIAVLFSRKIEVIKIMFGKSLSREQSVIRKVLSFNRPDAYVYELVFQNQVKDFKKSPVEELLSVKGSCSWGQGSFKETNRRYALLIVNWGGKEYYAFKCMKSETEVSVVQGGHFFLAQQINDTLEYPLICDFISNSIFLTYSIAPSKKQLYFLTTLQFEYGVPFSLSQIEKHAFHEKQTQSMSSGEYLPKFHIFQHKNGEDVIISQGVMDSVKDGYQSGQSIELDLKQSSDNVNEVKFSFNNTHCFILNGLQLLIIRLKPWDEYLEDVSYNGDWNKSFQDALDILDGRLTFMSEIPENDFDRQEATRQQFCKMAFTFILLELKDQQPQYRVSQSLLSVMHFLFQTGNEDCLFSAIEDLLVGSGLKELYYEQLCVGLTELHQQQKRFSIPDKKLLVVLKELQGINRFDIIELIVCSISVINFDVKPVIDFLIQCDQLYAMIHLCIQVDDFLTPYLRIITLLQVKQNLQDDTMTRLSIQELGTYSLNYIYFCMTGQHFKKTNSSTLSYFTERQFKTMLKSIFEYLFDLHNLNMFLQIDFKRALEVLLLSFQSRIQDVLKQLEKEGQQINIRIPKYVKEGPLTDILNVQLEPNHLDPLARIYVLIKQAELTYFSQLQQNGINLEPFYDISVAFTTHVVTHCQINFRVDHLILAFMRYITIMKEQEDTIFDINWVLKGKVQKKVLPEIVKNEFLWKTAEILDKLLTTKKDLQLVKDLLAKATQNNWIWLSTWCLWKLGKFETAFQILLDEPNTQLSDKIFLIITDVLKNKESIYYQKVKDWILENFQSLAQQNSQKLFTLLITYFVKDIESLFETLISMPKFQLDIKSQYKTDNHISLEFFNFYFLRKPFNLSNENIQLQHFRALCLHSPNDVLQALLKNKYPQQCLELAKEFKIQLKQ